MFEISTKGDYGLLLLAELGRSEISGKKHISLKEIAEENGLSTRYLAEIAAILKKAGLVKSKEGKNGGYFLSKTPAKISVMEILEALEGPITPVPCCNKGKSSVCGRAARCGVRSTWLGAKLMLTQFLRKKTLADICK
jgi:Rrf2 family protein